MKKIFGLFLIAGMLVVSACGTGAKDEAATIDSTTVIETVVSDTAMAADTTTTTTTTTTNAE